MKAQKSVKHLNRDAFNCKRLVELDPFISISKFKSNNIKPDATIPSKLEIHFLLLVIKCLLLYSLYCFLCSYSDTHYCQVWLTDCLFGNGTSLSRNSTIKGKCKCPFAYILLLYALVRASFQHRIHPQSKNQQQCTGFDWDGIIKSVNYPRSGRVSDLERGNCAETSFNYKAEPREVIWFTLLHRQPLQLEDKFNQGSALLLPLTRRDSIIIIK